MKKRVLFLMSDTGGGHRAAAEAIRDALLMRYGQDQVESEFVDVFRESQFPLNYMPEFYPWLINRSKASWGAGYSWSNTRRRVEMLSRGMYMTNARSFKRIARENPADVVVCVHSVIQRPTLQAFSRAGWRPPYMTVVTDLVSTHAFWYDNRVDQCLVPTQRAYDHGLETGLSPDKLRITGLPVHPNFLEGLVEKEQARQGLGWDLSLPAILMVAGGDGMGHLYETARAINARQLACQLVIVAGRNAALKQRLEADEWHQPTHVYPFITNMPQLMAGSDIIVTKAGPATITEASIAGLPMILSDAIPGQETGNVEFVVENDAGIYAPRPEMAADAVADWLSEGLDGLHRRRKNAQRIARPDAVWQIADEVWKWAHHGPVIVPRRQSLLHDIAEIPAISSLRKFNLPEN